MRPISKALLIHSCKVYRIKERDRAGTPVNPETIELQAVRFDITKGIVRTNIGETKADILTLFYDVTNSSSEPAGYVPEEQDQIEWNGGTYTIKKVAILYTRGFPLIHHYEAQLV